LQIPGEQLLDLAAEKLALVLPKDAGRPSAVWTAMESTRPIAMTAQPGGTGPRYLAVVPVTCPLELRLVAVLPLRVDVPVTDPLELRCVVVPPLRSEVPLTDPLALRCVVVLPLRVEVPVTDPLELRCVVVLPLRVEVPVTWPLALRKVVVLPLRVAVPVTRPLESRTVLVESRLLRPPPALLPAEERPADEARLVDRPADPLAPLPAREPLPALALLDGLALLDDLELLDDFELLDDLLAPPPLPAAKAGPTGPPRANRNAVATASRRSVMCSLIGSYAGLHCTPPPRERSSDPSREPRGRPAFNPR
jgi:hypothetical protein